jgi:phosphatidylinositol glycan class Q protein
MRLAVILAHAGVETVLAFLNHFPLFALMVRVKDPRRLPGAHHPPVDSWLCAHA